jgi:hypothetical protein
MRDHFRDYRDGFHVISGRPGLEPFAAYVRGVSGNKAVESSGDVSEYDVFRHHLLGLTAASPFFADKRAFLFEI